MSYKERVTEMYNMINSGQMLEAFDKYYREDVVMEEATGQRREGKQANREFEEQWLSSVKEVHGGGVNNITSDEENGITMVETWMDVEFQDGNRMKMEQIARQQWEDGQIKNERFYYNAPEGM